jgi:hypothetical protein
MFNLSLVDHIRLSFGHVIYTYQAHAQVAGRLDRLAWRIRLGALVLSAITVGACLAVAMDAGRVAALAATTAAALAFIMFGIYFALDLERRVYAHRSCSARLWLLVEKYRALLSDIHDGLLDTSTLSQRRDALMSEVHAVYEHAPPADRQAYQIARKAFFSSEAASFSDEELDRFLPEPLRRHPRPATT